MRRFIGSAIMLGVMAWCQMAVAADFPPMQNRGAVNYTTMTAVAASTTPVILLSTGTTIRRGTQGFFFNQTSTNQPIIGQVMSERLYMEIFNDTGVDIYLGYSNNVSTMPGVNYGRRMPTGSALSYDGSIPEFWVTCPTTTLKQIVVTQQK